MKIKRALISVSDKTGLDELVRGLDRLGVQIISTGGTAGKIRAMGIPVTDVADHTGFPEMLGGRVKTLHPRIHAGLLALREDPEHMKQIEKNRIPLIDMLVVNLYPFEETVRRGAGPEEAIENIDIGGPSMLRSAAKNFRSVVVVSSPKQYGRVLKELKANKGEVPEATRKEFAAAVFRETSRYDSLIHGYLSGEGAEGALADKVTIELEKIRPLRYGENPHQKAAFYRDMSAPAKGGIAAAEQMQGRELSFNNIMDLSVAMEISGSFKQPAVSIVKHSNPCGVAAAGTIEKAYLDALDCDRMSAFGGIMGFNRKIDGKTAKTILDGVDFVECIIAPGYDKKALDVFKAKKNLRLLKADFKSAAGEKSYDFKKVSGGVLLQEADDKALAPGEIRIVTKNKAPEKLMDPLLFAWKAVKYVKSNAIVLCQGTKTVGIGAGQMSRVDSVIIAVRKAGKRAEGSVLASDAFFPKADSIEAAHKAGVSAIIQPGGSIKDKDIIRACDRYGIPMVFTGTRHFRH